MRLGPWTEERDAELRRHRDDGLSFGLISNIMGISRNALIGRAQRIGLNGQPATLRRGPKRIPHPRWQKLPKVARRLPPSTGEKTELAPEIFKHPKPMRDLDDGQCRWPDLGEGAAMLFCGAPALADRSYCWCHCFIAYQDFPEPPKCEPVEPTEAAA